MSQPRVALLTGMLSSRGGGVSAAVREFGRSLAELDRYSLRALGLGGQDANDAEPGLEVRGCPVQGPAAFGYAPRMRAELDSFHPDLVHAHGLWMYPSLASLRYARKGNPYIVSAHGMLDEWALRNSRWKKRMAGALYENRHLHRASCLHALNRAEADAMRAYGLRNPICVIPNGVRLPASDSHGPPPWSGLIPGGAHILLFLGRIHPKKGLAALLRAWSLMDKEPSAANWHLAIAGWDQQHHEDSLQELCRRHSLHGVHFLGPQFGPAKASCFAAASGFILPSVSEGLPIAVLEAWSWKLPVLMTPECNLPEGFAAAAALNMDPNADSIAASLRKFFSLPEPERLAMGARGRALVEERFSWPRAALSMATVYDWVLEGGPAPATIV